MPEAPTHELDLNNGAALELAQLANMRGLVTKSSHARKISQFIRKHLRTPPEYRGDVAGMADWSETAFSKPTVDERTRDALKALIQSACEKGAGSGNLGFGDLCTIFGLGSED